MILYRLGRASPKALQLLERLYFRPIVSVQSLAEITGLSFANANGLARQLEAVGLLRETTGRNRNAVLPPNRSSACFRKTRNEDRSLSHIRSARSVTDKRLGLRANELQKIVRCEFAE